MSSSSWLELSHILATPPPPPPAYHGALPPPPPSINDVAFDTSSDLLYTANSNGGVASWYGPGLARYTAWKADVRHTIEVPRASSSGSGSPSQTTSPPSTAPSSTSASSSSATSSTPQHQQQHPRRLQVSWKKAASAQQQQNKGHGPAGVRQIYADGGNVYSASPFGIHCANRRGLPRWSTDVAAMGHPALTLNALTPSPTLSGSDIIVAGTSAVERDQQMISVNRHVGSVTRKVHTGGPVLHVCKSQKYLLSSTRAGHIQLRDPRSLEVEHKLHAHPGGVIDMKSDGSLVWSIGWTIRLGQLVPEPLIKVHDIRSMRSLIPIPFAAPGGPAHLDIHPRLSSTVIVGAAQGAWQLVDMNNPGEAAFFQMETSNSASMITSLSLSPSAEYIAFGESDGSVRLWSTTDTAAALNHPETMNSAPKFNPYNSTAPELPDAAEVLSRQIDWSADTPLSSVGLPYYDHPLCSVISLEHYAAPSSPLFNPYPPKVDSAVLGSMRSVDRVHFAPLPRHLRGKRNLVKVTGRGFPPHPSGRHGTATNASGDMLSASESNGRRRVGIKTPMFRSEKLRAQQRGEDDGADDKDEDDDRADAAGGPASYWCKKNIVYSKFGVEDFDFGFYNKTCHSGLETQIPNCYLNPLLQCLYHLPLLKDICEIHTLAGGKGRCEREDCLLCEAGYLFMMLRDAQGSNCQATNFLRSFSNNPIAASLGLMDHDDPSSTSQSDVAYANLIQSANRFLMDALASAWAEKALVTWGAEAVDKRALLESILSPTHQVSSTCQSCGHVVTRPSRSLVIDLAYPRKGMSNERSGPTDFASILTSSMSRESSTKMLCKGCKNASASIKSKRVLPDTAKLPQVLSINANVLTDEQMGIWCQTKNGSGRNSSKPNDSSSSSHPFSFLPTRISIDSNWTGKNGLNIKELRSDEDNKASTSGATYQLKSMIVQVQASKEAPNLVSIVRMEEGEGHRWYLFNDFAVRAISEEEALHFPTSAWKIPAVVYYERVDCEVVDVKSVPWTKDWEILTEDINISKNRDPSKIRHRVLTKDELPTEGTLVSIDAEFVALNGEEMELSSSGSRSLIRPSTLSLARVSVLRGQGPLEGEAFIDDHIETKEEIYDYLTQFSGITKGDLDVENSRHTLIQRKLAYKKLRLLVDLKCKFIGHGLSKDFRIINIFINKKQQTTPVGGNGEGVEGNVIDTVDLFSSKDSNRKLSLRFLSWFLLKESIQQEQPLSAPVTNDLRDTAGTSNTGAGHDSIEDARAALHLFRIYETFEQANRLDDVMDDLYIQGKKYNWRPPPVAQI
ncbi:unnamed protein product [Sympodiomycopsis kandeliae]